MNWHMRVDLSIFYVPIQICALLPGDVEMVKELNNVIEFKDEDLLLSYDTTFNLGEFYVSSLSFQTCSV